jgi:hypothetical protein
MWAEFVWLEEEELRPLLGLRDLGNESLCARETGISLLLCLSIVIPESEFIAASS